MDDHTLAQQAELQRLKLSQLRARRASLTRDLPATVVPSGSETSARELKLAYHSTTAVSIPGPSADDVVPTAGRVSSTADVAAGVVSSTAATQESAVEPPRHRDSAQHSALERLRVTLNETEERHASAQLPFIHQLLETLTKAHGAAVAGWKRSWADARATAAQLDLLHRGMTSLRHALLSSASSSDALDVALGEDDGVAVFEDETEAALALRKQVIHLTASNEGLERLVGTQEAQLDSLRRKLAELPPQSSAEPVTDMRPGGLEALEEQHRREMTRLASDQMSVFASLERRIAVLIAQLASSEESERRVREEMDGVIRGRTAAQEALAAAIRAESDNRIETVRAECDSQISALRIRLAEAENHNKRLVLKIRRLEEINGIAVSHRNAAIDLARASRREVDLVAADVSGQLFAAERCFDRETLNLQRKVFLLSAALEEKQREVELLKMDTAANKSSPPRRPVAPSPPPTPPLGVFSSPTPPLQSPQPDAAARQHLSPVAKVHDTFKAFRGSHR